MFRWLTLLTLFTGCARHRVDADVVHSIGFEGNGQGFSPPDSPYRLRQVMQTQASSFGLMLPVINLLVEPKTVDHGQLAADAYALEIWYAHHGWFDAQFTGFELRQVRPRTNGKSRVVDVVGHVTPGPRSMVRAFDIQFGERGPDGRFAVYPKGKTDKIFTGKARVARRSAGITKGSGFDLDLANAARAALVESFRDSGRAYADVQLKVEAFPDSHEVDVRLEASPGVMSFLGPVTLEGNSAVPTEVILDEADLGGENRKYRLSHLRNAQKRLFDLQMFAVVTITPDLSDPTRAAIPIHIKVTETKARTLRTGGGIDYTGLVLTPRVRVSYDDNNLFGKLFRFEAKGDLGYAYTIGRVGGGTPVYGVSLSLAHARLFGNRKLGGSIRVSVEQDVQNGQFAYFNPQADLGVTYKADKYLAINLGPHFEQYRYLDLNQSALIARSTFGEGFVNPYTLTAFDASVTWDSRSPDPVAAVAGWFGQFQVRQAIPFGDGDFLYTEVQAEARGYHKVRRPKSKLLRWVPGFISGRVTGDVLQSVGERPLPYPERVFLGGANDVRGFWDGQVGPYDCLCLYRPGRAGDPFTGKPGQGQDLQKFYAPRGGAYGFTGAVEARWENGPYGVAAFANVGILGNDWADVISPSKYRVGYGAGLRYKSGVGPIRLDLAFRPLYEEDVGPASYVNCLVQDQTPRSFDIVSLPTGSRDLQRRWLPFATVLYVAIGQAI